MKKVIVWLFIFFFGYACSKNTDLEEYLFRYLDKLKLNSTELNYVVIFPEHSCRFCIDKILTKLELYEAVDNKNSIVIFVDRKMRQVLPFKKKYPHLNIITDSERILRNKEFSNFYLENIIFFKVKEGILIDYLELNPDIMKQNRKKLTLLLSN